MRRSQAALAQLAGLALAACGGLFDLLSVPAVPEDAAATEFSARRAWHHLEEIAAAPRLPATAGHAAARSYLLDELRALGLEPETQQATAVEHLAGDWWSGGRVENVMARIPGRESGGPAVLLMSHYDSALSSPGAADDGAGVAAMLEAARAVLAGEPLRNDVVLLFTDGEESGLLGARAFADEHPWAKDVTVVVNLEARGVRGPSLMFETSKGNGRLVEALRDVPHKTASSYSVEVYRRMPNDTDFSVFRDRGVAGLNFAFIHGATAYHHAEDSLARLDPRSVQDHGQALLALSRHFGDADLAAGWEEDGDAVYFNLLGPLFVTYPAAAALPLAVLAALLAGLAAAALLRAGRAKLSRLCLALAALVLVGVLLAVVLGLAATPVFGTAFYAYRLWGGISSVSLNHAGLALLVLAAVVLLLRPLDRKLGRGALTAAGLLFWSVLALLLAAVVPGASYLASWPLLPAALAVLLAARDPAADDEKVPPLRFLAGLAAAVLAGLLWTPFFAVVAVGLGGAAAVLVAAFTWWLLTGLLPTALQDAGLGGRSAAALAAAGAAVLAAVAMASVHGTDNRRPTSLFYVLDTESSEAHWYSQDDQLVGWTAQALGDAPEQTLLPDFLRWPFPFLDHSALRAPAPAVPLDAATVTLTGTTSTAEQTTLDLRVTWPFTAHQGTVVLSSAAPMVAVAVEGRPLELDATARPPTSGSTAPRTLLFYAPHAQGIELRVELADSAPTLRVETIGQRYELPPSLDLPPRPPELMPAWGWSSETTYVRGVTEVHPDLPEER